MDTNTIIAVASTVIALSALLLSVYQARSLKLHNRFSVRPFLQFNYHSEFNRKIMLHVTNGGLGPAILKKFKVSINGNVQEFNEKLWDEQFKEYAGKISVWLYFLSGEDILQVGEEKELIRVEPKPPNERLPEGLENSIDKMRFIITYESFYEEPFEIASSTHRRST